VNESFVDVIDFGIDLFVIVIDFVIAILEKCLEIGRSTGREPTWLIFFLFPKNYIGPESISTGIKKLGTFVPDK